VQVNVLALQDQLHQQQVIHVYHVQTIVLNVQVLLYVHYVVHHINFLMMHVLSHVIQVNMFQNQDHHHHHQDHQVLTLLHLTQLHLIQLHLIQQIVL